jgi:putative (di)nucleoside polyphosphate hydrolase
MPQSVPLPMLEPQTTPHLHYRPCVGIALFNSQGLVFAGRRCVKSGAEHVNNLHAWQMPQGGIDADEDPKNAALRELYEETNIQSVSFLAESPLWYAYTLPDPVIKKSWRGKYHGQTQKWFAFRFEGDEREINIHTPVHGTQKAEFEQWRWIELNHLPDLIIPFKRAVYQRVVADFMPFV